MCERKLKYMAVMIPFQDMMVTLDLHGPSPPPKNCLCYCITHSAGSKCYCSYTRLSWLITSGVWFHCTLQGENRDCPLLEAYSYIGQPINFFHLGQPPNI